MPERNILITVSAHQPIPVGYKPLSTTKDGKVIAISKDSSGILKE